jgi:uncharacterized membrane protein (UPF0182 family)
MTYDSELTSTCPISINNYVQYTYFDLLQLRCSISCFMACSITLFYVQLITIWRRLPGTWCNEYMDPTLVSNKHEISLSTILDSFREGQTLRDIIIIKMTAKVTFSFIGRAVFSALLLITLAGFKIGKVLVYKLRTKAIIDKGQEKKSFPVSSNGHGFY